MSCLNTSPTLPLNIMCNILHILCIMCNTSPNHYYYHSITLQLCQIVFAVWIPYLAYIFVYWLYICKSVHLFLFCWFPYCFIVLYCYATWHKTPLGLIKFCYVLSNVCCVPCPCSGQAHQEGGDRGQVRHALWRVAQEDGEEDRDQSARQVYLLLLRQGAFTRGGHLSDHPTADLTHAM